MKNGIIDNNMIVIVPIILVFTSILLAYLYMTRKFNYWKKRGVFFIPPLPFVGNFLDLIRTKKSPGQLLDWMYNYGNDQPYVGFFALDEPMLLLRDPEIIKRVLVKDFNIFSNRHVSASPDDHLGSFNLFTIKNPAWKYLRSKLTPIFTSGRLRLVFERMLEVAHDLDTHLNSLNLEGKGKSIELKELCAKFTTDIIGMTAYGLKVNSLNDPDAEFRKNGRKVFKNSVYRNLEFCALFFKPGFAKPLGLKFFSTDATEFLRDALWSTLIERERSGMKRNDLIDLLIELKKSDANSTDEKIFEFDGDNLVAQAAVFFTAGFDTSSSLLSFTLYELALHPEIQTRVRNEINEALEKTNGKITYELMNELSYSHMVLSETLRIYPPLPFLDRVAGEDYKIPGHDLVIEKGMVVYIPMTGIQKDPKYHENPDKYDPERFSDYNKESTKSTWMPFGEGPHACIGIRMGFLQAKLGLLKLISEYEFSPCKETTIPLRISPLGLITSAESGIILNARKIEK